MPRCKAAWLALGARQAQASYWESCSTLISSSMLPGEHSSQRCFGWQPAYLCGGLSLQLLQLMLLEHVLRCFFLCGFFLVLGCPSVKFCCPAADLQHVEQVHMPCVQFAMPQMGLRCHRLHMHTCPECQKSVWL